MITTKSILLATLATACTLFGSASAQAGGHVSWSVGISAPAIGAVVSSGPVYAPYPVYETYPVETYPVYAPAPVYVQPPPVYYGPAPVVYGPALEWNRLCDQRPELLWSWTEAPFLYLFQR